MILLWTKICFDLKQNVLLYLSSFSNEMTYFVDDLSVWIRNLCVILLAPFNLLDDGFISFKEYLKIMQDNYREVDLEKERMKAAFRYIDKDNDGFLTLKELKTILSHNNSGISDREIEQFFEQIDTDGDGKIDYEGRTYF